MFLAGYLFVFFLSMLAYRRCLFQCQHTLTRMPLLVRFIARPAWIFYAFLGSLLLRDLWKFVQEEVIQSEYMTKIELPHNLTATEAAEFAIPGWLRWFALSTPFTILATFVVTLRHIISHVQLGSRYDLYFCTPQHDMAMQVVGLPVVYGMMSFKSLVRICRLMTGLGFQKLIAEMGEDNANWDHLVTGALATYNSNYELADLYEAWALWCFSSLCVNYLKGAVATQHMEFYRPLKGTSIEVYSLHTS